MSIRGVGRINKAINIYRANRVRKSFSKIEVFNLKIENILEVQMVSFSGEVTINDQIVSILSFVKNVGYPKKWIVFSDGSHSKLSKRKLQGFNFIEIIDNFLNNGETQSLTNLTWMEKKYYYFSTLPINITTIFLDSDILFFPGFNKNIFNSIKTNNWYLSDLACHFDEGFLKANKDDYPWMNYTNSGFFILNKSVDWKPGNSYLNHMRNAGLPFGHFSEQTAMEIVFKHNNMCFLDPRLFSMSMEDHFTLETTVRHNILAIRHFVGPIRFRMWLIAAKNNFFI